LLCFFFVFAVFALPFHKMAETKSEKKGEEKKCTIKTRKFMVNPLLSRKQFIVDVIHPGRASVSKKELQAKLAQIYKIEDLQRIFLYGFKTAFGGGRSTGFSLIYDTVPLAKKFEPKYRLIKQGLVTATATGRKQRKERRNRAKKVRGKKKAKAATATAKK